MVNGGGLHNGRRLCAIVSAVARWGIAQRPPLGRDGPRVRAHDLFRLFRRPILSGAAVALAGQRILAFGGVRDIDAEDGREQHVVIDQAARR